MSTSLEVDTYIASFTGDVGTRLRSIRRVIHEMAPDAVESMSYGMPAYKLRGKPLVYFAAFLRHIGFYATPNGHEAFAEEFKPYKQGKGSVQFPHDQPLPMWLVRDVVAYRVRQLAKPK